MKYTYSLFVASIIFFFASGIGAQCKTWTGMENEEYLTGQHSVYRGMLKNENFKDAFKPWKEVYDKAPAADGMRDFHYTDGIKIYMNLFENEADATQKNEYITKILSLYDEAIACYEAGSIKLTCNAGEDCVKSMISSLYSRKAYDMYYFFGSPYADIMKALQRSMDVGGMKAPYTVVSSYAEIAVYEFTHKNISKEQARKIHGDLLKLCDDNIAAKTTYATYYDQAKAVMLSKFNEIENHIFDCDYFKVKWMTDYEDNSNDPYYARDLYTDLRGRGCDDKDEFLVKLSSQWEAFAAEENARRQAEFETNNPGFLARKLYDDGDFGGAIEKYREAIALSDDAAQKAQYYFSISSILFRKMSRYSEAREEARRAAQFDPSWGKPHALIGDMYSKTASGCGDSWNQSLAILAAYEKWAYARSKKLDEHEISDINSKLSRYSNYFPTKDEGFMRGAKPGSSQSVGCWIGESVVIRYR